MSDFEFKKKFGQNFLSDKNLLAQIVEKSGVMSDEVVVEIGAGKGALTEALSQKSKSVYSFEIDDELQEYLKEKFDGSNVHFVFEDVMKVSDEEINEIVGGKFRLVANLPYYVTSPILTRFLQNPNLISATVMVQEEVADRIVAKPKTKDYGVLTVICQMFGDAKKVIRVNRKMFYPVPNVDSAVVHIEKTQNEINNFSEFIGFVKKAFSMRRKKLSTNLESPKFKKADIEKLLEKNGFSALARAEELSIDDFKKLHGLFSDKIWCKKRDNLWFCAYKTSWQNIAKNYNIVIVKIRGLNMKKILKGCLSFVLAFTVIFSLTACKTKLSKTTIDTSKVKVVNGVSTNGGITAMYKGYLYFINGTKTNDGTSSTGNKRSAICRVKYNEETGEVNKKSYEVVVDDLVGYEDGSLYFFGDFLYYATPCSQKNNKASVLYNKTTFKRYDLVNKKSHEIFTTSLNDESETISYAYYVVGDSLNLVVYESTAATITSLRVGDEIKTNYVIEEVGSCVLSENNGICQTEGKTVDANSYVFYTLSHDLYEEIQTGVKVYKTSPKSNNSKLIANNGESVSLVAIRAGKLIYSVGELLYADVITDSKTEQLSFNTKNIISYLTYDNVIFVENDDNSISLLTYDPDTYQVVINKIVNGVVVPEEHHIINVLSKAEKFEFVTIATVDEVVVEDDEETTDVDETETQRVKFLVYIADSTLYKLEISREEEVSADEKEFVLSKHTQPIKLSTTTVQAASGLLVAEAIGNYMFVYGTDDDKKVYMYQVDLTIKENATKAATKIAISE